ncbi:protein of unknown function [Duganella sp. CF517]|uniref:DUF4153 domain-containing protein n=1 Tax=Duganella sp. CF517 TaxID=1881038 RepID=UPI0008D5C636|nr:DUF4153 domain-containing protein [Duganella sp. CF517]SEN24171.1 protein of unknown function [Duganella sp. CF517]
MELSAVERDEMALGTGVSRRVMAARLVTGLLQGVLLYWLYRAGKEGLWPATAPYLAVPLMMLALFLPVLLVSSVGHMPARKAAAWLAAASLVILAMALHDAWRGHHGYPMFDNWTERRVYSPSQILALCSVPFFFIAQSLVLSGVHDRRRVASYGTYFEVAWKLGVQLLFSVFFVGALFMVLFMGSALFKLIKLNFLEQLLTEAWFNVPVVFTAFSCAMHITDVRPAIVRGIRTLLLVLMSWILPVAAVIVTGFLCSLPFTGLQALWETRHATSVLLAAVVVLVVLINAAFQNGDAAAGVQAIVRLSTRAACILIFPLTAIGIYALGLRVAQYGWTTDRIIAAACLLVASCYAIGYAWAAYQYDTWLRPLAPVNVTAAFLVIAVMLALFTPIADPARISVNSQMARLESGKTAVGQFDFRFLRFEGGRYGKAALERLEHWSAGGDVALVRAEAARMLALADHERWPTPRPSGAPIDVEGHVTAWPSGARLPASFVSQRWQDVADDQKPECLRSKEGSCDGFMIDLTGDGVDDVLLINSSSGNNALMTQDAEGKWRSIGSISYKISRCHPLIDKLKQGDFSIVPPKVRELDIGGHRVAVTMNPDLPETGCGPVK